MNERLNELRLDAGIAQLKDYPRLVVIDREGNVIDPLIGLAKFAELIVKEMCDMMRQCQADCEHEDASETNWGYISQLQDWVDRFEEHFGVEE